ncbi:MAG: K(+)-transporting ATPase subunit C [Nostoc sp. ChiSLP02]|nr:K(+)-transporting ATPase subunit C [Nostoc sp. DedSLP05]MDZ8102135.1 K(+)-transporting ATPase subunit C [Nostoc sp. DedSLP01]MDZ8189358.1 K(+)-transporting ATPase subunit C [Nostoc sp. ChiSLP02]
MAIIRETIRAIFITLMLWLLTGIVYPLIILVVGQTFLPYQANGSIVQKLTTGEPIGSALIGQIFTEERYFHPRPSTVRYSQGKKARPTGISGASNLAPSNPELLNRIVEQSNQLRDENLQAIADIIYTSGSGLDPHISIRAARQQLERVARARGVAEEEILRQINKFTDDRFLWIFGEPGVNILRLNNALDVQDFSREKN